VESDNSVLKEFQNLGLLQVYSQKKQPLIWIDQIIDKLKSGDYGEDFSPEFESATWVAALISVRLTALKGEFWC
jgi:hypothetical protein